jgi:signal transduction histidine kinase
LLLRVRDTGVGLTPELISTLFDHFQQADSSMTRRFGGLGLGLAIVRRLVELHSGTVEAESAGPGQGTTVIVKFPLLERSVVCCP